MLKKIIIGLVLIAVAIGGYIGYKVFLTEDHFLKPIYLVPSDAIFVVETDEPVESWQKFSGSEMWQYIKGFEPLGDIGKMADNLDKIISSNSQLFSLVGSRHLLISSHLLPGKKDYDFLFAVDFEQGAKFGELKSGILGLLRSAGYKQTERKFKDVVVNEMYDPKDRSTLTVAFLENHMVCSFNNSILENSITEYKEPKLGRNPKFIEVDQETTRGGLCRIYVNYDKFAGYLACYMDDVTGLDHFFSTMYYTGLDASMDGNLISLKGYSNVNDSVVGYLPSLALSGKSTTGASKILSNRTAFMLSLGFDKFTDFYNNLENNWKQDDKSYKEMKANMRTVEKLLNVKIQDQFFSWIGNEICIAQYENTRIIGNKVPYLIALKMKSQSEAKSNLDLICKQVKKRTPLKFIEADYKGYPIRYMEIKGLFRLLFGKLFSKIEKPYFTYIGDYVVFCDDPKMLLETIEDNINNNTLINDPEFEEFKSNFNDESTVFTYINTKKYFLNFKGLLASEKWENTQKHKQYVTCFKQVGFQFTQKGAGFKTNFNLKFEKVDSLTENPLRVNMNDSVFRDSFSGIDLFIIENLNKDVHKDFYDNGNVKLVAEMHNGEYDGRYISYFENGTNESKGKFNKGQKVGKWKYYNDDGKLIRKERYNRSGTLKRSINYEGGVDDNDDDDENESGDIE